MILEEDIGFDTPKGNNVSDSNDVGSQVFSMLSEGVFGHVLSKHGYETLTKEQKSVLSGLLKMQETSHKQLGHILQHQSKMGVNSPLVYIIDIIISSNFRYGISDLYYLTLDTSFGGKSISLEMFSKEKIYELGWMNFTQENGRYHKRHFFKVLVEAKSILGASNIDLSKFYKFYITHLSPQNPLELVLKRTMKGFFRKIKYLFTLGEKETIWSLLSKILVEDPRFDVENYLFQDVGEMEEYIAEICMSQYGARDISRYPQEFKRILFWQMQRSGNIHYLLREIDGIIREGSVNLEDVLMFVEHTRYSINQIHTIIYPKVGKPLFNLQQRFGDIRGFFDWIFENHLDARKFSEIDLYNVALYDSFEDIHILQKFHQVPSVYYKIKNIRRDISLEILPKKLLNTPSKVLPLLTLLYDILLIQPNFDFSRFPMNEKSLFDVLSNLKSQRNAMYGLYRYRLQKKVTESIPQDFFQGVSHEKFFKMMLTFSNSGYSLQEIIEFSIDTGYNFLDIYLIAFFPVHDTQKKYFGDKIPKIQYLSLKSISSTGIHKDKISPYSLGYYIYTSIPFEIIPYLPSNCDEFLFGYLYQGNSEIGEYSEVSYDHTNSCVAIINEIRKLYPRFSLLDLLPFLSTKVLNSRITPDFLENILLLFRAFPHIDISRLDPKLLLYSDRLQVPFFYNHSTDIAETSVLFGALLKNPDITNVHQYNIKILEQLVGVSGLGQFFEEPAFFDMAQDKMKIMRQDEVVFQGYRHTPRDFIRKATTYQYQILADIPAKADVYLSEHPEGSFVDLLGAVFSNQSDLTFSQRYDVIIRLKRYYGLKQEVTKYVTKYPNAIDLLMVIAPTQFLPHKIVGKVEVVQEGTNCIFYFSEPQDFIEASGGGKDGMRAGGFKFNGSKIPSLSGTISFVNGKKGTVNSFTNSVKIHEAQHVKNGFIFQNIPGISLDIGSINHAKDEIIAYMSDGSNYERILEVLTDEEGLYNYYRHRMYRDYKDYIKSWKKHIGKVKKFLGIAFFVKSLYPDSYLDMLAVTDIHAWESLLEGNLDGYHTLKKKNISIETIKDISKYFNLNNNFYQDIYIFLQEIIENYESGNTELAPLILQRYVKKLRENLQKIFMWGNADIIPSGVSQGNVGPKEQIIMFLLLLLEQYEGQRDAGELGFVS